MKLGAISSKNMSAKQLLHLSKLIVVYNYYLVHKLHNFVASEETILVWNANILYFFISLF